MSSQTKLFIEISDLTAIRVECKRCHSSVSLPMNHMRNDALRGCPNCGEDWLASLSGADMTKTLSEFKEALKELKEALAYMENKAPERGFLFTLETKHNPDAKLP